MKYEVNARADLLEFVAGSFGLSTTGVAATSVLAVASGTDLTLTANATGTAANSYKLYATADGTAKASYTFAQTNLTTVIEAAAGHAGTAGNQIYVYTIPHTHGSGGVLISEDTTNHIVNILFEDGVSTGADVETAIGTCTLIAVKTAKSESVALTAANNTAHGCQLTGGTAATWAEWAAPRLDLHFTDSTTTVSAARVAINAVTGIPVTATGTDTNVLAAADVVSNQAFSGGVAAIALDTSLNRGDDGVWSVARKQSTGTDVTGTYTLTFLNPVTEFVDILSTLQLAAADDKFVQIGATSVANKTIDFEIWDISGIGLANPTVAAGNRINFTLFVRR